MNFAKKINPLVSMLITGISDTCKNEKTGDMVTQWFMRSDMTPLKAHECGADSAVCFDCPLRKTNVCYVSGSKRSLAFHLASMYRSLNNGKYEALPAVKEIAFMLHRKPFRFGGYGEPVLFDFEESVKIAKYAPSHCGYTHAWRWCDPKWSQLLMASVETLEQREAAHEKGYRTARVIKDLSEIQPGEVLCDYQKTEADIKAGKKCRLIQCCNCGRCSGTFYAKKGKKYQCDVVFLAHGQNKNNIDEARAVSAAQDQEGGKQ